MTAIESDIDKFVGDWVDSDGNRLIIGKRAYGTAAVSFLRGPTGTPVVRPYFDGLPSTDMPARLRDYGSTIEVDLWRRGKGFSLHLTYEYAYPLDEKGRDSLVPAFSRREKDQFIDEHSRLFGNLRHYTKRTDAEQPAPPDRLKPGSR
jgi:hypothetical protein